LLNGLDLFSGIGGLTVALMPYVRPLCYCEHDKFAQSVLLSRMSSAQIPVGPIWDDVRTLSRINLDVPIDIVYGGFPCQDISTMGTGKGLEGERSGLFFEIVRLVRELRPRFVFLENVPAIVVRGLDRVLLEFIALGYDSRWTIVSAAEVGAVHIRERWFLLAHANGERLRKECGSETGQYPKREKSLFSDLSSSPRRTAKSSARQIKPRVDRAGDGLPFPVDRNRALGNAVVPAQAREAFMRLMGINTGYAPVGEK
jgi:DNA (cytosine-5)-methyltransferase 1